MMSERIVPHLPDKGTAHPQPPRSDSDMSDHPTLRGDISCDFVQPFARFCRRHLHEDFPQAHKIHYTTLPVNSRIRELELA
jgi:hypothetical protein